MVALYVLCQAAIRKLGELAAALRLPPTEPATGRASGSRGGSGGGFRGRRLFVGSGLAVARLLQS